MDFGAACPPMSIEGDEKGPYQKLPPSTTYTDFLKKPTRTMTLSSPVGI